MRINGATKNEGACVDHSYTRDTIFDHRAEIREILPKVIEKFRKKGATSPDKAIYIDAREFPPKLKKLVEGRGRLSIFVEVNGKYYLSERRLKGIRNNGRVEDSDNGDVMFNNGNSGEIRTPI